MSHRFFVAAVNAAVLLALLAGVEFGTRAIQRRRYGPRSIAPSTHMDRWTAWRNSPDFERIDIRHNSAGFRRDTEVAIPAPPLTVRILFMGGSAAYGCQGLFPHLDPDWQMLYNRDLIDVYLERKLNERHRERRWEVINAAVNEYRMHQHLMLLYSQLLRFRPDLVIFLDGHNDISGLMQDTTSYDAFASTPHDQEFNSMVYPRSLRSLLFINSAWLRNNSAFYDVIYRKAEDRLRDQGFGPGPQAGQPVHSPVALQDLSAEVQASVTRSLANADYYVRMAERLQNALQHEGVLALFSMQPELILSRKRLTPAEQRFADHTREMGGRRQIYLWENLRPRIVRDMTSSAEKKGYTFVELNDVFDNVPDKAFTDYCHLTPKGNERIAERLYQAMQPALIPQLTKPGPSHPVSAPAPVRETRRAAP